MAIQFGNEIEDRGFSATRRPEQGAEHPPRNLERNVLQDAQPFAVRLQILLADFLQGDHALRGIGTSLRHFVSRFSTGLNSKYSMTNITRRNKRVHAKTCDMENSPNQSRQMML